MRNHATSRLDPRPPTSANLVTQPGGKVGFVLPEDVLVLAGVEVQLLGIVVLSSTAPEHGDAEALGKSGLVVHGLPVPGEISDQEAASADLRQDPVIDFALRFRQSVVMGGASTRKGGR